MKTEWLLIALFFVASTGCARRDWVSDMLTLADVTGTWTGSVVCQGGITAMGEVPFRATFRQSGSRVTGTVSVPRVALGDREVEGVVNGDVLGFTGRQVSAEATVDGDEMNGLLTAAGYCSPFGTSFGFSNRSAFYLRRESSGRPGSQ